MLCIYCKNDLKCLRIAEFHHDLPAYSARRCILCHNTALSSYNTDCIKFFYSFADCLEKRGTLRTVCRCISRIFNIASRIYPSILSKQRSSHFEVRIRGIRICKLRKRDFYHFFNLFFFHSLFSCFFLLNKFIQNRMPDRSFRHFYTKIICDRCPDHCKGIFLHNHATLIHLFGIR